MDLHHSETLDNFKINFMFGFRSFRRWMVGIREGMSLEVSHLSWTKMAKYPINRNDPFPISIAQQKEPNNFYDLRRQRG